MERTKDYFGKVGNHHDFTVIIDRIFESDKEVYLETHDRLKRKLLVRVLEKEDQLDVTEKDIIFFRGQILSHSTIFDTRFTYIEATSCMLKA